MMNRKQRRLADKGQGDRGSARLVAPAAVQSLFAVAFRHHQAGRLPEAERACRQFLAINPRHPDCLNLLGMIAYQSGRHAAAVDLIGQAVGLRGDVPVYHYNLGAAFRELGKFGEAVAHYQRALTLKPDFAEAHNNLGNCLKAQGKYGGAMVHYQSAIALKPDYAEAHSNLGNALQEQGNLAEAVAHCERAVAVKPDFAAAQYNLGNAFQAMERHGEAVAHYRKALAIAPKLVEAHIKCAAALQALNRHDEAIAHCERVLAIAPNSVDAYNHLGRALAEIGRIDEACRAVERAIEIAPRKLGLYVNLFNSRRVAAGEPHLAFLEALALDRTSLADEEQIDLDFALGKAYSDIGQHERSFRHLLNGNALKRRQIVYDEAATLGWFDDLRRVVDAAAIGASRNLGDPSSVPVFIVGMMRSGSTLVEQILASHPRVFAAGERKDFGNTMKTLGAGGAAAPDMGPVLAFDRERLRWLGSTYLAALRAGAPAADKIIDKMPANFRYLGLIHQALPNARIIHTCRDPIDTCLSCFSTPFTQDQSFTYDLGELGRYYRAYQKLMEHWHRSLPDGMILDVRYEELVTDFETQAHRIVAHCGLEWDNACLYFYETQRPVKTASVVQVRQPIYRTSVGRWRPYQHLLQPLIKELGVELEEAP